MNRVPRLLPLIAVAIGGVLAIKALAEIDAVPKLMAGARAFAADAGTKPAQAAAAKPAATTTAASAAPAPIKICAPSPVQLARDAGLSPAELQVLQSLGARRTQLDAREQDIDLQLKLLAAAEAKVDAKLKGLNGLKAELAALVGQTEAKETAEIDRLVIVYSKMKPRDSAAVITQLEDKVRLPVAGKMKEATLAAVLSQMPPSEAKKLTESLAHRFDKAQELAQAALARPSAAPVPAATSDDPTAPAKLVRRPPARRRPVAKAAPSAAVAAAPKPVAQAAPPASTPTPPAATPAATPAKPAA